ncbi:MAG: Rne/Rng family ribonuclease [Bacteroidales bacterium]
MSKELIINVTPAGVVIALLEDKQLVEIHREKNSTMHSVGDVFLGRVKKVMPGLNAAFVEVGSDKEGFLHLLDLGTQIQTITKYVNCAMHGDKAQLAMSRVKLRDESAKTEGIGSILKQNQQILVQVAKEPISTKGPRLSAEISFAGRYIVLVPFGNKISISQKIKSVEERNRLKSLILSIRPQNYGVIIRTVAEGKSVSELNSDLRNLVRKWESVSEQLHNAKAPMKVFSEMDKTVSILRDFLSSDFLNIAIDNANVFEEVKGYIETIAPDKKEIVKQYKGKEPIFDYYGISKQIKASFGKVVPIRRNGAYLVIEHTEAMHVIDVNSGHRVNADQSQEDNALDVNLEAAVEVARQMRLRDMGGITVIDFIDQREAKNRKILYDRMVEEMAKDPSKHNVLPPTKFGLIQITRQRVRPQTQIDVLETCPTCGGTGEIKPSVMLIDEIEGNIEYLVHDHNEKHFSLSVNPYIYAYLKQSFGRQQFLWWRKYKRWIKINKVASLQFLEYKFIDQNGEEIEI